MKRIEFKNIKDVLLNIKSNDYDRHSSSFIGSAFCVDEPIGNFEYIFSDELNEFSFLFYFLNIEFDSVSDIKFKYLIDKMLLINDNLPINYKKVLYKEEIDKFKDKLEKGFINQEIYEEQIFKYLG